MGVDRIAVVGGGIVGASVASHLGQRTDDRVVVYERGDLASETTAKSTAMIGVSGPDPYHRMKEYGFRLYNEFYADPATDVRYRQAGRLRLATTEAGASELAAAAEEPDGHAGAGAGDVHPTKYANSLVDYLPGEALRDRFVLPPLDTDRVEGALYRPQYGYVHDDSRTLGSRALALEFVERARDAGVRFEPHTEVTDVHTEDGSVTGIEVHASDRVDDGPADRVEVETVVSAAGPWNGALAEVTGLDLPIDHVASPVFALALDEPLPYSLPMCRAHEWSVGIHPKRDDRILVTYTPGVEGDHRRIGPDSADDAPLEAWKGTALDRAERLVPRLADVELVDEWVGVGTVTPDGYPIVGWTAVDGLVLAATMAGIQYAPAVGSIVARQVADGEPTEYYDAVSISRFDEYDDGR